MPRTSSRVLRSLRSQIQACVLILAGFLALGWSLWAYDAYERYRAASAVAEINALTDELMGAVAALQEERWLATTLLRANEAADAQDRAAIADFRARAAAHIERAFDHPGRSLLPELEDGSGTRRRLTKALEALAAKRGRVDGEIVKNLPQRAPEVALMWPDAATEIITDIQKLWIIAGRHLARTDGTVGMLAGLKQTAVDLREWVVLESALIEVALTTENRFTPSQLQEMAGYRARAELLLASARQVAEGFGTRFQEEMKAIDSTVLGSYERARGILLDASSRRVPYPIDAAQWRTTAGPTLAALTGLKTGATRETAAVSVRRAELELGRFHLALAMLGCGVAVAVGAILLVRWRVARPLTAMTRAMTDLAKGNLDVAIQGAERGDEIGDMATAVAVFRDGMKARARLAAEREADEAARHVRQAAIEAHIARFTREIGAALGAIQSATGAVEGAAATLGRAVSRTTHGAGEAEGASRGVSDKMLKVAATIEQLSASIGEISEQVAHTSAVSSDAVDSVQTAERFNQSLSEAADRIGAVVSMISQIAEQTNLLALNATIEAARAGEAGRGFAVVAAEVKTLASQTGRATEDIARQIGAIQSAVADTVATIRRVGTTIRSLNQVGSAIAASIHEQTYATGEIAGNVRETSAHAEAALANIADVTAVAGETASAAERTREASDALIRESVAIERVVARFLEDVRAA